MSLQSVAVCSVCGNEGLCVLTRADGRILKVCGDCVGKEGSTAGEAAPKEPSFDEAMERNKKNKERMEKERLNANKSVLRSYRIKP